MIKPGDTVRYLNSVGGGKVTRVDGKIAYVDDNGFETPFQTKELVVVLPAGAEPPAGGAKLMFNQKAFDEGKKKRDTLALPAKDTTPAPAPAPLPPQPQTSHGN
ncbi:MAG: hypothetical protein K2G75_05325, partial [Muribaculaceae bacterium]|nr:hypothetical protein [Muribaculaceae bacterium]